MSIFEIQGSPLPHPAGPVRSRQEPTERQVFQSDSAASVAPRPMSGDRVASEPKRRPIRKIFGVGVLIAGGTTGAVLGVRARNANKLPDFAKGIADPLQFGSVTVSGSAAKAYNQTRAYAKRSALLGQIVSAVETAPERTYIRDSWDLYSQSLSPVNRLALEQVDAEIHASNMIPWKLDSNSERLTLEANGTQQCSENSIASALLIDLVKAAGNQAHALVAGIFRALADPYHYTFENHRAAAMVQQEGASLGETIGLMPYRNWGWQVDYSPPSSNTDFTAHGFCTIPPYSGGSVDDSVSMATSFLGEANKTLDFTEPNGLSSDQSAKFRTLQADFAAFNRTVNEKVLSSVENASTAVPQRDALYQRAYAFGEEIEQSLGRPTDHTFMPREAFPGIPVAEPAAAPFSGQYTIDFPPAPAPASARAPRPAPAPESAPVSAPAPVPARRLLSHFIRA